MYGMHRPTDYIDKLNNNNNNNNNNNIKCMECIAQPLI